MPHTEHGLPFAAGSHESYRAAQRQLANRETRTKGELYT